MGISEKQDENIYNLTKKLLFNKENKSLALFSFLDLPPREFDKDRIQHYIIILKQMSIDLKGKTSLIQGEEIKNFLFIEKVNANTLLNLCRILYVLKEDKNNLLNCVKDNIFLVLYTFNLLLRHFYFYIIEQFKDKKKNLSEKEGKYNLIFEEMINFVKFYNENKKYYENNDQLSISNCLLYIIFDKNYCTLVKKLNINIKKIKSQFFVIPNNNSNSGELIQLLNMDIFAFSSAALNFYFYYCYLDEDDNYREVINDEAKNIIYFIFDAFLSSINQNLKKKYKIFISLYNDIFFNELKYNKNTVPFSNIFGKIYGFDKYSTNYENTSLIIVYIYIKKLNQIYSPYILLSLLEKKQNTFFKNLNNCLSESKYELKKEKHLFLDEKEISDYRYVKLEFQKYYFNEKNIKIKINKFINKYLIDLNYLENSIVFQYIADNLEPEYLEYNKEYLSSIIFNYYISEKNDLKDNRILHNKLMELFSNNYSFYGFLNEDYNLNLDKENRMIKKIKIIKNLIKYASDPKNKIIMTNSDYCTNYVKKDNFLNLYSFLKAVKLQNKKLIDFENNNFFWIIETIKVFINVNDLIENYLFVDYSNIIDIETKTEYIRSEIKEFFKDLIFNEKIRSYLMKNEAQNCLKTITILKQFKKIQEKIGGKTISYKSTTKRKENDYSYYPFFKKIFLSNIDRFYKLLEIFLTNTKKINKDEITKYIIFTMKNNIERFFNHIKEIQTILSKFTVYELEKEIDTIQTIQFIFNNSNFNIYSKLKIINNSYIYNDLEKSFILLGKINNQDASLFIYKKITKLF